MAKSISRYLADATSTTGALDGLLSIAAQTNITSLGTLSSLTVSGSAAMTLTTAAQPNITSVGTLSSLTVSGNIGGTLTTVAQPNITSLGTLTTLTVDDITIDGSTISDGADLTIDVGGDIILDAAGSDVRFHNAGTLHGRISTDSSGVWFISDISDKDIIFRGNDGGSMTTALTLDMSAAGAATFNDKVIADSFESTAGGTFTTASGNDLNIVYPDSRSLFIKEGSTTHVAVDNTGKVGIGVTSPGAILSLPAGESNTPRFAIESAVDDNDFTITQYEDSTGTYTMIGQNVKLNSGGNNTVLDSAHKTAGIFLDARSHGAITFITGEANTATEHVKIDSSGRVLIGLSTADTLYGGVVPTLQVEGTGAHDAAIGIFRNSNDGSGPTLSMGKSRGTAVNSDTVVQSGDYTGTIAFTGADGGERMRATAAIKSSVDGTPGDNDMPGRLTFWTTPDGAYDEVERMRIDNGGRVTMPSQPVASYGHTSGSEAGGYSYNFGGTGSVSVICKPQGAVINRGSVYNSSTGKFTAPVAGVYRYAVHGNLYTLYLADGAYFMIQIRKNGAHYVYHYEVNEANSSSWLYNNMGGLISMAKDDYLEFRLVSNNMSGGASGGFGWDSSSYTHYEFQLLY